MEKMPKAWDRGPSLDLAVLIEDVAAAQLEVAALAVLLKKRDYMHASSSALGWWFKPMIKADRS